MQKSPPQRRTSSLITYDTIMEDQLRRDGETIKTFIKMNSAKTLHKSSEAESAKICAVKVDDRVLKLINPDQYDRQKEKEYKYDKIFDEDVTHEEIYESISESVLDAIKGYNVSVICQGCQMSGKTHIMMGFAQRTISDIFTIVKKHQLTEEDTHFHVEMSYVQLYNDAFKNLLSKVNASPTKKSHTDHDDDNDSTSASRRKSSALSHTHIDTGGIGGIGGMMGHIDDDDISLCGSQHSGGDSKSKNTINDKKQDKIGTCTCKCI